MKNTFFIIILIFSIFISCSETYEDYSVSAPESSYSVVVGNKSWGLKAFRIRKLENNTTSDTSKFQFLEIQIYDNSFPYSKELYARFYFDEYRERMEISNQLTDNGLISSIKLTEINLDVENIVSRFYINDTMPFIPEVKIFDYDLKRKYISGVLEGAVYKDGGEEERVIKINFENYQIR